MAAVTFCASASAQSSPVFANGNLVAHKMEAHYNGAAYKAKLARNGARLTSRVLCAYDHTRHIAECDGHALITGLTGQRYRVSVQWQLSKLTATRARLHWTMRGDGASESRHEIVAPSAYGLTRF